LGGWIGIRGWMRFRQAGVHRVHQEGRGGGRGLGVWVMWSLSVPVLVRLLVRPKCTRWAPRWAKGRKRVYRLLRRVRPAVRRMWMWMVLVFMAMLRRKRRRRIKTKTKTKTRMQRSSRIRSRIRRAV